MNAAGSNSTGTASHPPGSFQVFDETEDCTSKAKDIISRTASMGIQGHEASPFSVAPSNQSPRGGSFAPSLSQANVESDAYILNNMVDRIATVLDVVSKRSYSSMAVDSPSLTPMSSGGPTKWVTRYVDYTSKYGLGFLLNDGRYVCLASSCVLLLFLHLSDIFVLFDIFSSGVYFNDSTKTVLEAEGDSFQYIERKKSAGDSPRRGEPSITLHTLSNYPESLQKKVTLLKHFRNYLIEQQQKSEDSGWYFHSGRDFVGGSRHMVYLKKWVRTKHAIFFRLSDQTVQIVFYDHTEVLLTPDERYITYVDKNKSRKTYFLTDDVVGCNPEIAKRLKYTKEILQQLLVGAKR
jgi:polo-like kinase 1